MQISKHAIKKAREYELYRSGESTQQDLDNIKEKFKKVQDIIVYTFTAYAS